MSETKLGVCVVTYKEAFSETAAFESLSTLPYILKQRLVVFSTRNAAPDNASLGFFDFRDNKKLPYNEEVMAENLGLSGGYNKGLGRVQRADVA